MLGFGGLKEMQIEEGINILKQQKYASDFTSILLYFLQNELNFRSMTLQSTDLKIYRLLPYYIFLLLLR